jgi:hypothetical protein
VEEEMIHNARIWVRERFSSQAGEIYRFRKFHLMIKTIPEACAQSLLIKIKRFKSEILQWFHGDESTYLLQKINTMGELSFRRLRFTDETYMDSRFHGNDLFFKLHFHR